jgi:LmbE family N-acetylglucosaminyl deacetylase
MRNKSSTFIIKYIIIWLLGSTGTVFTQNMNSAEILLALKKLRVLGSALYIAAHPDDENTALLAYLSKEKLVRTGYLSLTRGDGGQNLIGTETAELLGVLRTQELLAARRVDGAEQFFTRAIDFGYSKNPEETLQIWEREKILSDMVWIIRQFRPDIIITRFTPDQGGHGHHCASAILALEAFRAAGDANRFPEQLTLLETWQSRRIFWNTWRPAIEQQKLNVKELSVEDIGSYNHLLGKSYGEIAAISRSNHKSQGFGAAPRRGTYLEYFQLLEGDSLRPDIFAGIDLSWKKIRGGAAIDSLIQLALQKFEPEHPAQIIPILLEIQKKIKHIPDQYWKEQKQQELLQIIRSCLGLWMEANANKYYVAVGDSLRIILNTINRSDFPLILKMVKYPFSAVDTVIQKPLQNNIPLELKLQVMIPSSSEISQPYWLKKRPAKGSFNIDNAALTGRAENSVPLAFTVILLTAEEELSFTIPVTYKWTDEVDGEKIRRVVITPAIIASFREKIYVFPNNEPRQVEVVIKSMKKNNSGTIRLNLPSGWSSSPLQYNYHFLKIADEQNYRFMIQPPQQENTQTVQLLSGKDQAISCYQLNTIDYRHIPIQTVFAETETRFIRLNYPLSEKKIGYIMGSGDEIPQILSQSGFQVTQLNSYEVENSELSNYNAIITGVRAYNTNRWLKTGHKKLLEYVKKGGILINQYNVSRELVVDSIGPYPLQISRDRVSVEEAPVHFLLPEHQLLNRPFKITSADFDGWVQERGLYFAGSWDSTAYQTPLGCNDPGEEMKSGGLLYTTYGKGVYIYTGFSFFRQLPAGIPGALKLFINLLYTDAKSGK